VENLQQAVESLITGAAVDWSRQVADGALVFRDPHAPSPAAPPSPPQETESAGRTS
jgi:hypothetical protein